MSSGQTPMHVVALGDVHGNARALRAALVQARRGPMDRLVFMGDLLTYGHDVEEVLELVATAQAQDGAELLIGNHDQMYFDIAAGRRDYVDALPDWIRDSVELTLTRFDPVSLRGRLRWSEEWALGRALFAHANPYPFGDFRYLNRDTECAAAAGVLRERGFGLGVFGHTHRAGWWEGEAIVANAGSVGQPRDAAARSVILRIRFDGEEMTGAVEPVDYDIASHLESLDRSGLRRETVKRLRSYFHPEV